ncbi:MAG: SAM-dependent methyltransferase, partial [Pseudomonadota bacterium]
MSGDGHKTNALADAVVAQFAVMQAMPLDPALYLIATPIGHLGDISIRALDTLARCDVIYCEDTRHTRKLLQRYALRPRLESYHEHNADRQRGPILTALNAGQRIALVSDAGTPLVSDPGHKLVAAVRDAG